MNSSYIKQLALDFALEELGYETFLNEQDKVDDIVRIYTKGANDIYNLFESELKPNC